MKQTITFFYALLALALGMVVNPAISQAQCGIASQIKPVVSASTVCSGNSVTMTVFGLPVSTWIYRDNAGSWQNMFTGSTTTYTHYSTSVSTTTTREYRAVVSAAGCTSDTTLAASVTLVPATYGNSSLIPATSTNTVCSGSNIMFSVRNDLQVSGWYYRDNGVGSFNYFGGSNQFSTSFSAGTTTNREIKVLTRQPNSCQIDSSQSITITVQPRAGVINPAIGISTSTPMVCSGSSVSLQLNSYSSGSINWLYRNSGTTSWTYFSASANATDNNTTVTSNTTREYRVVLQSTTGCTYDSSSIITALINAPVSGNLRSLKPATTTPVICSGSSSSVSVSSGYSGSVIRWLYRDNNIGSWNIFSSTSTSISQSINVTSVTTRAYRILLRNAALCRQDTSEEITVLVNPFTYGNTTNVSPLVQHQTICSGYNAQLSVPSGVNVQNWLYRTNGGTWQYFSSGQTVYDYNTTVTASTNRDYVVLVRDNSLCRIDTSSVASITIKPTVYGSLPYQVTPNVTTPVVCYGNTSQVGFTLNGNYQILKWIYKDNAGTWTDNSSTGSTLYDYNTSVSTNTNRTYRAIIRNNEICIADSTQPATVAINTRAYGNLTSVAPTAGATSVCSGTSVSLSTTLPANYTSVQAWYRRDSTTGFWTNFGSGTSVNDNGTTITASVNREYRSLFYSSTQCRFDTSAATYVSINLRTRTANNSVAPQLSTTGLVCSGKNISSYINLPSGTSVQKWIYRDGNTGTWLDVSGSSASTSYTDTKTGVLVNTQRFYRVIFSNNNTCSIDTSASLGVSIQAVSGGTTSSYVPTASASSICSGTSVFINASSGVNSTDALRWTYKDNSGQWLDANSGSNSFSDPSSNTLTSSNILRSYRLIHYRSGACVIDTTSSVSVNINSRTSGTKMVAPSVSPTTACATASISIVVSVASGEQVQKYIYRDNAGAWRDMMYTSSSNVTDQNTNVSVNTTRDYRVIFYNSNNCSYDTSLAATVTISPMQNGVNTSVTPVASSAGICAGVTASVNVSSTIGSLTVKGWIFRDNNGIWMPGQTTTSTTFNQTTYTGIASNINREYRVLVTRGTGCGIDTSTGVTVVINKQTNGYFTNAPTPSVSSVCATASSSSASISLPSGYTPLRWQSKDNSGTWDEFPYSTATTFLNDYNINVSSAVSRQYRVIASSSTNCSIDTSATAAITINPLAGGTINTVTPTITSTTVCYGQNATVSVSLPSGYTMVKWIYSDNNGPLKDFYTSATGTSFTDNNTQVQTTVARTYYAIIQSSTNCRRDTSLGLGVTIMPWSINTGALTSVTPTSNPTGGICSGNSVSLNVNPGANNSVYKWIYTQYPTGSFSGPTYDILNSASTSVTHSNTYISSAATRLYRAVVRNNAACRLDTTNSVWVNINLQSFGTDTTLVISAVDTVCSSASLNLSISTTGSIIKWLYRDNNGPLNIIPSSAGVNSLTDNNTTVSTGVNRKYYVLVFKNASCSTDTSKVKAVYLKARAAGNSTTKAVISVDTVCIGTSSVSMSISASNVLKWIYRDNFSGSWNIIPSSASSFVSHNISNVTSITSREYRAIFLTTSCSEDTSVSDTVVIKTLSYGNFTGLTPTSGNNVSCNGNSATISVVPGSGNSVIKWIYRDNNTGTWLDFSTTTSTSIVDYNTYVTTPQTRVYRVIIRRACSNDTTDGYTLSLLPRGKGNDNTLTPSVNNSTVCTGSSVTASLTPGSGKTITMWLYRNGTSGAWSILSYTSSTSVTDNYTVIASTTTRQYCAIVYNTTLCSDDTTNSVSVTINPVTLGTTNINPTVTNSTVCVGNFASVSINPGTGASVVGWLYNVNGGAWIPFGYTTSTSINDYNTNFGSTTTKAYRALIYTTSPCHIDTSNSVSVTITPRTFGNDNSFTFTAPSPVCSGSSASVSISAIGSGNSIQRWLYRDNSTGTWNSIYSTSTAISDNNTYVSSVTTRTYRALIVKGNACTIDTSNSVTVTINPVGAGNDNAITPTGTNSYCTGAAVSVSVNPGSGNSVYGWIYRLNNTGAWQTYISYNTTSFVDYNTSVSSTTVKSYRALVYKPGVCRIDTSAEATATINPRTYGNLGTAPTASSTNVCSGSSVTISISTSGTVNYWLYKDNSGSWTTYNYPYTSFNDYNTNVGSSTTRQYRAVISSSTGCTIDTSATLSITISPRTYGNSSTTPTVNNSTVCSGTQVVAQVAIGGGSSVIKWMYRDNNTGAWLDGSYSSSTTYYDYNTTVAGSITRGYRALILSGTGCSIDTTNAVNVTINPIGKGNSTSTPAAANSTVCAGNTVSVSLTTGNVMQWLYRDGSSGSWTSLGTSGSTMYDYNTNVGSNTVRNYRAIVYNTAACSYDTTNAVTVNINLLTSGNSTQSPIVSNSMICSGNLSSVSLSPVNGYVQNWLYRDGGTGAWTVLTNYAANSYNDYNTTVTSQVSREYRAIIRNQSACSLDTSVATTVVIKPLGKGSDLSFKPQVSQSMICSGTGITLSFTGNPTVQVWMYRDSVIDNWNQLSSGNFYTHYGTFTSTVKHRTYVALVYNTATCSIDTTDIVSVTINPNTTGNVSIVPVTANSAICSGNFTSAKIAGYIGQIQYWIFRDNNGPWNIYNSTSDSITQSNTATTVTALTSRQYRAIIYTGCNTDSTQALSVSIDIAPAIPTVTKTSADTLVCSAASGVTYKWIRNGVDIPGATSQKYKPTQSGSYVVEISNANGCKIASVPFNFIPASSGASLYTKIAAEVYPNPTGNGEATVLINGVNAETVTFSVMNAMGQVVVEKQQTHLTNSRFTVHLENMAQGLYFILIETEGKTSTLPLMRK
ncbi:MAG: T9SS type A sorting domain-containing protein [Bacteroidia bacterium]|nr:T9SS type A sorting domain-containing protein [Bacteroidia bacterium]